MPSLCHLYIANAFNVVLCGSSKNQTFENADLKARQRQNNCTKSTWRLSDIPLNTEDSYMYSWQIALHFLWIISFHDSVIIVHEINCGQYLNIVESSPLFDTSSYTDNLCKEIDVFFNQFLKVYIDHQRMPCSRNEII